MKLWQECRKRVAAVKELLPVFLRRPRQFFSSSLDGGREISSGNQFNHTRRVLLIRGYQTFLQLYFFLDNGSY
jgi:hypothetical protein